MNAALRALLTGLIDYAGLFPPAKLPMDEAVRNYLRYRDEAEGWMLGRFICPAARLGELTAFDKEIGDRPMVVAALGRGETADKFLANLEDDLKDVAPHRPDMRGRVVVDVLEVRLPPLATIDTARFLLDVEQKTARCGLVTFYELTPDDLPRTNQLLALMRQQLDESRFGYKLRCGGLDQSAFPSCEQVAAAVSACSVAEVPFKATAGLHHPLPRFDETVRAQMHGFINLFAGGVLTGDFAELTRILQDDDPSHFRSHDGGMSWGALSASVEMIRQARQSSMISFGSCSFDEPRDDLRALGWL